MNSVILHKDKLEPLLSALMEGYTLWAPVRKDDTPVFAVLNSAGDISLLDLQHQARIIKNALFPQTESLFTFDKNDQLQEHDLLAARERIIFGIRSCDVQSFRILDPVFQGEIPDPYYLNRRNRALLIGVSCREPFANCFCTSLGGNPFSQEGLDLLFTELPGGFLVDVVTEKGREIIEKTASLFTPAAHDDVKQKEELAKKSETAIKRYITLEGIPEKLNTMFKHPVWKQLALKCIGCGICTYTCPTCYCFDIQDESTEKHCGKRVRVWDSCMFGEYTLHASGHNPRPTRVERLRNRIYHKFKYAVDNFGVAGCVGCGRCISLCPVNEDIIENLTAIMSVE